MNDPLKKFVERNREAFDQLEPPSEVLQRLQVRLKPEPAIRQHVFRRYPWTTGLVAASLLIGLACTYLLVDLVNHGRTQLIDQPSVAQQPVERVPLNEEPTGDRDVETPAVAAVERPKKQEVREVVVRPKPVAKPLAIRLADSSSASTRLAAILEIEQAGHIDDQLRTMLSETMNHDGNTNVRLAALDVLSHHLQDPQVADLLATSLTRQDDPLVQLGIVRIAAQIDHIGIEEALFAVARNPYTFTAVKDEAYAVLLYQDKL